MTGPFNLAKNVITKRNRVYIVEGYNDVIAWHKFGLENTVGICGTALTDKHLKMLKKLTSKITICLDGDDAGIKAIKALSNKFGNQKISFHANEDYILLPNIIAYLLSIR